MPPWLMFIEREQLTACWNCGRPMFLPAAPQQLEHGAFGNFGAPNDAAVEHVELLHDARRSPASSVVRIERGARATGCSTQLREPCAAVGRSCAPARCSRDRAARPRAAHPGTRAGRTLGSGGK